MRRRAYQTDLSDAEWSHIEPLIPAPKAPGRPRVHALREILINAIFFYIVKSGCAWRLLPHDFPPFQDHPPLPQDLADRRHLGEDARRLARAGARAYEEGSSAQCRDRRQPVGEDHRCGRRARLRWWEEGEGKKTSLTR